MTEPKKAKKSSGARKTPAKKRAPSKPRARKSVTTAAQETKRSFTEREIRNSAAFQDATSKAELYAKDPERLRGLFEDARKKTEQIPRGPFAETWAYLLAMIRLIRAYYAGEYREISWRSLVVIIAGTLYFVSPYDFIPDWIPILGLIDDAFVIGLVLKSVKDDIDAFMEWETSQKQ